MPLLCHTICSTSVSSSPQSYQRWLHVQRQLGSLRVFLCQHTACKEAEAFAGAGCRLFAEMIVGALRDNATTRCAGNEPELEQVRLVNVKDRVGLFARCGSDGIQAHRPAIELVYDRAQYPTVAVIK